MPRKGKGKGKRKGKGKSKSKSEDEVKVESNTMDYLQYFYGPLAAAITGTAVASAAYYIATRPTSLEVLIDLNMQSKELTDANHIRVSKLVSDDKRNSYLYEDAQTLYECMLRGARVSNDGPCMGWRASEDSDYEWLTYRVTIEKSKNFGCGLVQKKLKHGSFVGIYSQNSVECMIAEQACYSQSMVIVPLYDTLGPHACTLIINEANISTVICDKEEKVAALLASAVETPTLKVIIAVDKIETEETRNKAKQHRIQLIPFTEIEELGKKFPSDPVPPYPKDLATVCYTSGTTGNPKGVMLTHGNIMANVSAVLQHLGSVAPAKDDVMLSFLPLAHMFERCCQVAMYMVGGKVGFFRGSIHTLADDLKTLKPTVIPCVPRLLNKMYSKVQENVKDSRLRQILLHRAIEYKKGEINNRIYRNNSFWDWLVLKNIQEQLGGRVRLIVLGSAPIAGHVLTFLRCALGCVIVEGYGQTECVAPCTMTIPGDASVDHVGPPLPCCSVKLVDVPDMMYFSAEGKGEVCVKGDSVFQGYLKDTEKTQAVLDEDGWLHTGDIGAWQKNGSLKILDRKKHIFKLSQGEYVVPEKIENIYLRCSYVAQAFVHGESLQACLVGIIVPEKEHVYRFCQENNIHGEWTDLCANKEIKKKILDEMTKIGKSAGLKSFEQVKDIYLCPTSFAIENGLLTPTLKTKRTECLNHFSNEIENMYSLLA